MGSTSDRFDGFFKSEFRVNEAVGRSVSYVRDGKLLGGNSGFAHIGTYRFDGDAIAVDVTSRRHFSIRDDAFGRERTRSPRRDR